MMRVADVNRATGCQQRSIAGPWAGDPAAVTPLPAGGQGLGMARTPLYPLRFEPIFTTNLWGGRRLPQFLNRSVPHQDPIGEAWLLSDVDGRLSVVAEGPLAGQTLRQLMASDAQRIVGTAQTPQGRFPLLLKFLDAQQELSVQVHPNDEQAAALGPGLVGKTEAWVVLEADPHTSRLYAGFAEGITAADFRAALETKTTPRTLYSFTPQPGDCVFLEAGTVHAIGRNLLLLEVQQTSDITYRLYDWDRVDATTGQPRALHIEEGLKCADFQKGPCVPVGPAVEIRDGVRREGLVACQYFTLERLTAQAPFRIGAAHQCRVVVSVRGQGELEWRGSRFPFRTGEVFLLPAEVGECLVRPAGEVTLIECGLPE
ncbi:MAG: class I mannose-6-phosphate isomerase [Gemmataceae bacterium]|nr:class I mannose-6-phosphate isomerase [Gemmata sp.]MDW8199468.1 class I mannose-6-phosphate isomerase [Gemmataceae bacterium]